MPVCYTVAALLAWTRRRFLKDAALASATAPLWPTALTTLAAEPGPAVQFPTAPRERIAIASYPFRDFIAGSPYQTEAAKSSTKMEIKDFAAHVAAKFNIRKIEPWSAHFPSTDAKYLEDFRAALKRANGAVANIAVDGSHSPYAADPEERAKAVAFSKKWIEVAAALGAPGIRTNIPEARDSKPDLDRAAESLSQVAAHGAGHNVVINLENDNPVSEDPFFIVHVIEKVNSPWLRANPDFCNTLASKDADYAYRGIEAMFDHAYSICHVKAMELNEQTRQLVRVDMPKTFAILKRANFRGYCSMEFDSPGDPYAGTAALIATTLQYL